MCIRDSIYIYIFPNVSGNCIKNKQQVSRDNNVKKKKLSICKACLLYTSDAADERSSVDLGGRRIIKKKKKKKYFFFFFFKQKTAYEMLRSLVGSEMCIRDSVITT